MEKNLINELNQMKFLFGYKAGKVMSEQHKIEDQYEGVEMAEQDVAEPEIEIDVDPDTDRGTRTRPNPFDPSREFDPFPDLEPQGKKNRDIEMGEPGVAEPEIDIDIDTDRDTRTRPNPFDPSRDFDPFPDLEPQGKMEDEESRDLDTLVMKYLNSRN